MLLLEYSIGRSEKDTRVCDLDFVSSGLVLIENALLLLRNNGTDSFCGVHSFVTGNDGGDIRGFSWTKAAYGEVIVYHELSSYVTTF